MISRLLYMIPFIGMSVGCYFLFSNDIAVASVLALLGILQASICLGFLFLQMLLAGIDGTLEVEVQLWDALMPVVFLLISFTSFLYLTLNILQEI